MPVRFGTDSITPIYKGTTKIDSIYHGVNLVYQSSLLPSGYVECEYLESTGTQYIEPNIIPSDTMGVYVKYNPLNHTDYVCVGALYPAGGSIGNVRYYVPYWFDSSNVAYGWNSFNKIAMSKSGNAIYEAYLNYLNDRKAVFDGTVLNNSLPTLYNHNSKLILFGYRNESGTPVKRALRVYNIRITNNNTLQHNFIPCLDNNFRPCLYDVISKQTFYNAGTGEFDYKISQDGLPADYTRTKWVQGPTTADNINSPPHPRIEIPFDFDNTMTLRWVESSSGQSNNLAIYNGTTRISYINPWTTGGKFGFYYNGAVTKLQDPVPVADKVYDLRLTPDGGYIDGVQITDSNVVNYPTGTTILNCIHSSSTNYYTSRSRNYLIQIIGSNNEILLNAVPCLDDNGVPCLYDTVSKTTIYKTPSTANDFLYG